MEIKYAMILAATLFLVFLLFKEIKRANNAHLFLRLTAVTAAVIALLMLVFPITYQTPKKASPSQLRLLTKGANVAQLTDDHYFTTDSSLLKSGRGNIQYLPDLSYYLQAHPELNRLQVSGYGLPAEELSRLNNYSYEFVPAPSPSGIIACSWPNQIKKTEVFSLQGTYHNTTDKTVKLVLTGGGSSLDSVNIKAQSQSRFSLESTPGYSGKALYAVLALQAADTLEQEKLPFQIIEAPKIKLLVLSSFPDFEYKFLKNWLYDNSFQVVFRTRISKDKFSTDQLNTTIKLQQINTAALGQFDGIIADDEELTLLSPVELQSLRAALSQGLGLLIRVNELQKLSPFARQFTISHRADSLLKVYTPIFNTETTAFKAIPAGQFYLQPKQEQQALLKDQTGKVLMAGSLFAQGKITLSVVPSTYNWVLAGQAADYARFWSRSIYHTVRKQEEPISWQTVPQLPIQGQQTALIYQSASSQNQPELSLAGQKLDLMQHTLHVNTWKGIFWPLQTGWNDLKIANSGAASLFIYTNRDWMAVRDQNMLADNLLFSKNRQKQQQKDSDPEEYIEKQVSLWWFFAVFLISMGYIWFETKML